MSSTVILKAKAIGKGWQKFWQNSLNLTQQAQDLPTKRGWF